MLSRKIKDSLTLRGYKVEKVNLAYDLTEYNALKKSYQKQVVRHNKAIYLEKIGIKENN